MACRGIRGATTVESNTREAILEAAREMLRTAAAPNLREVAMRCGFPSIRSLRHALEADVG